MLVNVLANSLWELNQNDDKHFKWACSFYLRSGHHTFASLLQMTDKLTHWLTDWVFSSRELTCDPVCNESHSSEALWFASASSGSLCSESWANTVNVKHQNMIDFLKSFVRLLSARKEEYELDGLISDMVNSRISKPHLMVLTRLNSKHHATETNQQLESDQWSFGQTVIVSILMRHCAAILHRSKPFVEHNERPIHDSISCAILTSRPISRFGVRINQLLVDWIMLCL